MKKQIVGFDFQEIPLEEARVAVLVGSGKYSEVKSKLLETIPKLPPDKAFAFGLPNGGELAESDRRGICITINSAFKKSQIFWKVTYSSKRKLFICIPRNLSLYSQNHKKPQKNLVFTQPRPGGPQRLHKKISPDMVSKIISLRQNGIMPGEIQRRLNISRSVCDYVLYQVAKKKERSA